MGDQTRFQRWESGLLVAPDIISERDLDICLMKQTRRSVQRGGCLKFENLTYRGDRLAGYAGENVILRYNPRDITTVLAYRFAEVRDIFDKLDIAVVLVGTDRLDAVIKRDEQVFNRFRACHRFGKLSGQDFEQAIAIWERDVLKLPVASNLTAKSMMKVLGQATGGYIGLLDMILRETAIRSLKKGLSKIDLATLKEVAGEYR